MELLGTQPQAKTRVKTTKSRAQTFSLKDFSSAVDRVLIVEYRKKRKESQRRFWARFGVTQSRGSRFESGADIPPPVSILLGLYFNRAISDGDLGRAGRVLRRPQMSMAAAAPTGASASVPAASPSAEASVPVCASEPVEASPGR
jgi:hypothetical protein